ncbi:MAG TPA: ZIP family metal transporter [Candidatus Paceibacterota bacterium]
MLYLIALATFAATFLGGSFALKLKDQLHLILGFSAGAVVAIAFFDLLPESLRLAGSSYSSEAVLSVTALGFLLYLFLDRVFLLHGGHRHEDCDDHDHHTLESSERGVAGASSLSLHSFLDGIGIGLGFQVAPAVGLVVAAAVLAHDFSDGINTVNFILKNGGSRKSARRWLFTDAVTPVLGILVTRFFVVDEKTLGLLLALFAGFFLYLGASDLIPESYHAHPKRWTTYSTLLGVLVLYLIIKLAGG